MARRILVPLIVLSLAVLGAGCRRQVMSAPLSDHAVDASLTASATTGHPGAPIAVAFDVRNVSGGDLGQYGGCFQGNPYFALLDPQGNAVREFDVCTAWPACPIGVVGFAAGSTGHLTFQMTGIAYGDACGETYALPPGVYTLVANFAYFLPRDGVPDFRNQETIAREIALTWTASP